MIGEPEAGLGGNGMVGRPCEIAIVVATRAGNCIAKYKQLCRSACQHAGDAAHQPVLVLNEMPMLPADHLPHTTDPNTDGHDLGNPGVTERDRMTDLMNGIAPAHLVREFQLIGQQGLLKIAPSERPLLPSGLPSDVTNKPLDVGSGAARRQQGEPLKIGILVWCGHGTGFRHFGILRDWIGR